MHSSRTARRSLPERSAPGLIHISTDCVFSGIRGNYSERDTPDAGDLYGRTKLLGNSPARLPDVADIDRRARAVGDHRPGRVVPGPAGSARRDTPTRSFSGLTTRALARLLGDVIERHPALEGVYHVASQPISEYDLLCKLNQVYGAGVDIEPSEDVRIDRTLDGSFFQQATGLTIRGWER